MTPLDQPQVREEKYKLVVAEGHYTSNSLLGLIWGVLKHRFWHWQRGDGWVD